MSLKNILSLDIKTIAILLLIGIVVFKQCNSDPGSKTPGETVYIEGKPYEVIKHKIDTFNITKRDTIEKKGEDIFHDTTIYVKVPINIDTTAILRDYYSKKSYKDTLKLSDNLGVIIINDTISKNSILHRKYFTEVSERYIKDMMIVKENQRTQLYYGANMGFDKINLVNSVNASLLLKTKKDKIYQVGAGFMGMPHGTPLSPFVTGGIYWKIKLRKK